MISEEEPVPKQRSRSPYVPGSSVESGFKMLFSKLFYFFSALHYYVSPARLSPYERLRCFDCILVASSNCSLHSDWVYTWKTFCPECTCLCMYILFSLCVYINVCTPFYKNNLEGRMCLQNNVSFWFLFLV